VSATIIKRTEQHEVHVEFKVTGYPTITDRTGFKTKHPSLLPVLVDLDYRRGTQGWFVSARVYGSHPDPRWMLMRGWADYHSGNADAWPVWLRDMAEENHPGLLAGGDPS
jgi:hypothetical protein